MLTINKSNNSNFYIDDKNDNEQYKNFNIIHSETLKEKSEDDVLKVERTILSTNNENEVFPKSPLFQGLIFPDNLSFEK